MRKAEEQDYYGKDLLSIYEVFTRSIGQRDKQIGRTIDVLKVGK